MTSVFQFFFSQLKGFYNALSAVNFELYGIEVSLTQIILGFICMSIIMLLAIDKDLGLKAVKAPALMELYFFCCLPPSSGLTPFPCQPVTSFFSCTFFRSGAGGFAGAPRSVFRRLRVG